MTEQFAAIVLAGGRGSRLGGADKAGLTLAGRTLLDRALDAVAGAAQVVVVGDRAEGAPDVEYVREQPAYAGPAAALLTGAEALGAEFELLAVLAVDMPMVTVATLDRLRSAAHGHDGAALVDESGRRALALVLRPARLGAITPPRPDWEGMAIWRLLRGLDLVEVMADGGEARDVDTEEDLVALRGATDAD